MDTKFQSIPTDPDTAIIFETEASLGDFPVVYQKWLSDGITGESIIFANEDVDGLSDDDLLKEVKDSPLVNADSKFTLKRSDSGFIFVNFNFASD